MQMSSEDRPVPRARAAGIRLFAGGFVLLVLALGFNALLTYGSIEKLYVASIVSSYQVVGKDLQRKLEQSLRFGKSIQKFIGMNNLLEETRTRLTARIDSHDSTPEASSGTDEHAQESVTVSVALPNAAILYSANEGLEGKSVPPKVWQTV